MRDEIARAADRAARDPATVHLIAVTKTVSVETIREAYDLGIRDFGESRWQEAEPKIGALPTDCRWHFIGKLQSNKARRVAQAVGAIHTLESSGQLHEIAKGEHVVDGFIEVNAAREPQKSGVLPETLDEFVQDVLNCPKIRLRGLMTIGPQNASFEEKQNLFRFLAAERRRLGLEWLSMGMSDDFGLAVQEGTTHVRVGSRIFGHRV